MKVGTKTVVGMLLTGLLLSSSLTYSYSVQVPKLEKHIQVLEHTVSDQRKANEQLMGFNIKLTNKLAQSGNQIQALNKKIAELKAVKAVKVEKEVTILRKKKIVKSKPVVREKELSTFQITWYNDTGITKSGRHTRDGITVSVDPRVIPLGTWVKIVFKDGMTIKRRADDTGSAVKGKVIDVYKRAPRQTLLNLGRQLAKVYVLSDN